MEVTVEDVLKLPSIQNCKVIAGKRGLNKTVRWFLGMLSPIVEPWVHEKEILFVYGQGMETTESALLFLVEQCASKSVSAIFFIMGPVFKIIPAKVTERADELRIPMIEIQNEVPFVDITREIAELILNKSRKRNEQGKILQNLIFGHESDSGKYIRQLEKFKYKLELYGTMNIIVIDLEAAPGREIVFLEEEMDQLILSLFGKNIFFWNGNTQLILLVNHKMNQIEELEELCRKFSVRYEKNFMQMVKGIGIGNTVNDITAIAESYENAQKALKNRENHLIYSYEKMGNLAKLTAEINNPMVFKYCYQDTVGKLAEYDEMHNSNLCQTLRTYLAEDSNIGKASKRLAIHRNTMVYRINKIHDILGFAIDDKKASLELRIAFYCYDKYIVYHNQKA